MESSQQQTQRLVSCQWLAQHLNDPNIRIIEVSSSPDDDEYRQGHIPGAVWWNWKDTLWHPTDREFSSPEQMAERLGSIGVTPDMAVVLYGSPVQYGTYAFWVLAMAGHRDVRLLDGSRTQWVSEGLPMSKDIPLYDSVSYTPGNSDPSSRVGRDNVRDNLNNSRRKLLDVRSPEEYNGERVSPPPGFDHGAERRGRIPGAEHLFYRELLNEDDTFKTPEQMFEKLSQVGLTPNSDDEIVTYCRLSHRATLAWFALENILGFQDVKIYDGSWTEWGSIVGFPVERS